MQTAILHFRRSKYKNIVDAGIDTIEMSCSPSTIGTLNENNRNYPHVMAWYIANPITGSNGHRGMSSHQSAKAKLADTLLMVAQRNYREDNSAPNVLMSLCDIADYLGLTINKICYELNTMDRQGAISVGKLNRILLIDLNALQEIAMEVPTWAFGAA